MTHTIAHLKEALRHKGVKGYSGKTKVELEKMCHAHHCMPGHHSGEKFIQKVISSPKFKKGALTKTAHRHGESPLEFAKEVLAHPEKHDITTRRRAQFLINIQKRKE